MYLQIRIYNCIRRHLTVMQSSKWNAMSLLMDDKTKQAEVLRTAIEEA